MPNNFSENLRYLLALRNLKQKDFAKSISGTSTASVSSWVQGISKPPVDKLIEIAAYFDVSIDELLLDKIGDPFNQYHSFIRKNHPGLIEKSLKSEGDESINKDQIIRLLQEKLDFMEKQLPNIILKTLEVPLDQINDLHIANSRRELRENLEDGLKDANEAHKRENQKKD